MKNASNILLNSLLSAHAVKINDGKADGWVKLIPAGVFTGRDGRGPYDAGDHAQLERIVAETRRYKGPTDLVVDYEHQTLKSAQNGKPAPAAGWIREVEARDDGIYGLIEWTVSAQSAIEAKEYRYLSPVYFHTKAGKVLALQCAALINTPNLYGLGEITAHSALFQNPTQNHEENMDKLLAALGLSTGASEDDVLIAVNSLQTGAAAIAVAAGLAKDAKPEEVLTAVQGAFADRDAVAKLFGVDASKSDAVVVAAQSALSAAVPDPAKYVPIAQVTAMQADLTALKTQIGEDKAKDAVEDAIKSGKRAPALKEWGLSMHSADPAKFAEFIGKAPVLTSSQRSFAVPPSGGNPTLDETDETVIAAMGLDRRAYLKTIAAEKKEA
jgi:phage I-like protein